jgi:hypothetical protein
MISLILIAVLASFTLLLAIRVIIIDRRLTELEERSVSWGGVETE